MLRTILLALTATVTLQGLESSPPARKLYVTAADKNGIPVADLSAEELVIVEGRSRLKPDTLSLVSQVPRYVALLVDISGSRRDFRLTTEGDAAARFFRRVLREGDSGLVVAFEENPHLLADLTSDVTVLEKSALRAFQASPRGSSGILPAIYSVSESRFSKVAGRKVMVVITDGVDNSTGMKLREVIQNLQAHRITIYFIRLLSADHLRGRERRHSNTVTRTLANETGGIVLDISREDQLPAALSRIAESQQHLYEISFVPPQAKPSQVRREISIESTRNEIKVFAPRAYVVPDENHERE